MQQSLIEQTLRLLLVALVTRQTLFAWIVDFNNPIVHTQYGSIRGRIDERKTKFNRRPICTFLSIPYARPPVGANRFMVSGARGRALPLTLRASSLIDNHKSNSRPSPWLISILN